MSELNEKASVPTQQASVPTQSRGGSEGDAPLIELRDLKVHFPIKSGLLFDRTIGHVYAVDGVSLSIRRGETYGLVGESGCGKSTLGGACCGWSSRPMARSSSRARTSAPSRVSRCAAPGDGCR